MYAGDSPAPSAKNRSMAPRAFCSTAVCTPASSPRARRSAGTRDRRRRGTAPRALRWAPFSAGPLPLPLIERSGSDLRSARRRRTSRASSSASRPAGKVNAVSRGYRSGARRRGRRETETSRCERASRGRGLGEVLGDDVVDAHEQRRGRRARRRRACTMSSRVSAPSDTPGRRLRSPPASRTPARTRMCATVSRQLLDAGAHEATADEAELRLALGALDGEQARAPRQRDDAHNLVEVEVFEVARQRAGHLAGRMAAPCAGDATCRAPAPNTRRLRAGTHGADVPATSARLAEQADAWSRLPRGRRRTRRRCESERSAWRAAPCRRRARRSCGRSGSSLRRARTAPLRTRSSVSISLSPSSGANGRARSRASRTGTSASENASARPSRAVPFTCSGDMYVSLPLMSPACVAPSSDASFAMPKSATLVAPSLVMKMLSGLTSRWTRPKRVPCGDRELVRRVQAAQRVDGDADRDRPRDRRLALPRVGEHALGVDAVDVLHGDEVAAVDLAGVDHLHDVLVAQQLADVGLREEQIDDVAARLHLRAAAA